MFFDIFNGKFGFEMSDNLGMDSDGNMMMCVGDNMAMDMDSGEMHMVSGWDDDDDNDNFGFRSSWNDDDDW